MFTARLLPVYLSAQNRAHRAANNQCRNKISRIRIICPISRRQDSSLQYAKIVNKLICNILTWPLCLLFISGLALTGHGVLCLGDDGRLKVESACPPCCGMPEIECVLMDAEFGQNHHNNCADCTDLPLNQHTLSHAPSNRPTDVGPTILVLLSTSNGAAADRYSRPVIDGLLACRSLQPAFSHLSSSILRC